jgi:hypothetical protein
MDNLQAWPRYVSKDITASVRLSDLLHNYAFCFIQDEAPSRFWDQKIERRLKYPKISDEDSCRNRLPG